MWRFVSVAPPVEPVSIEQARRQCNLLADETDFDDQLALLITAARRHVEKVCGLYFGTRAVVMASDTFSDFSRLPVAPVTAITSVAYIDPDGASQEVPAESYELVSHDEDGIEPAIVPVYGANWPVIRPGSQVTLTFAAGFVATPEPVHHAMLLWIDDAYTSREPAPSATWTTMDSLLCNYRRGV